MNFIRHNILCKNKQDKNKIKQLFIFYLMRFLFRLQTTVFILANILYRILNFYNTIYLIGFL